MQLELPRRTAGQGLAVAVARMDAVTSAAARPSLSSQAGPSSGTGWQPAPVAVGPGSDSGSARTRFTILDPEEERAADARLRAGNTPRRRNALAPSDLAPGGLPVLLPLPAAAGGSGSSSSRGVVAGSGMPGPGPSAAAAGSSASGCLYISSCQQQVQVPGERRARVVGAVGVVLADRQALRQTISALPGVDPEAVCVLNMLNWLSQP